MARRYAAALADVVMTQGEAREVQDELSNESFLRRLGHRARGRHLCSDDARTLIECEGKPPVNFIQLREAVVLQEDLQKVSCRRAHTRPRNKRVKYRTS